MHQVIIVGAGPAGAYLAYLLSRQGVDVLLLEKERLPRYKPCGGGVSPKVLKLLEFDLDPVIEDTIYTVVFTHRLAQPITVTSDQPVVYMVSRARFDAFLVDQAKRAGAEVLEGVRINSVQVSENEVSVHSDGKVWQGQMLVGADGASSLVARALGLAGKKKIAVALEQEVQMSTGRLSQNRGIIKVDYGLVPSGYAWVFPKADHLSMGVGSILPKPKGLRTLLEKVFEAEGFTDFSAQKTRGWFIPYNPEPGDLHEGRALVIGDAAGLADSFTGEGIYAALFSARLAAEALIEQISQARPDLRQYSDLVQEKLGPELADAFRVTRWFYPFSGLIHKILRHRQTLAIDLMQVVAGNMTYAQFFQFFKRQLGTAAHF